MPAIITTPLRSRVTWRCAPGQRFEAAETAVPFLVVEHRLEEVTAPEVGPQHVGNVDLGVRDLHSRKLLTRISPLVRMSRSGSGCPAV